jgi:GNAT superfamily N-acetyltransferase
MKLAIMNNINNTFEKITLRLATDDDKAFARYVHHQAYHNIVVKQFGEWNRAEQDTYFESTWSKYNSEIILWNENPSGYWSVESRQNEIHLHQFLILPEYQGRKIGSYLLNRLIDQSSEANIPIRLQAFRESEARKLYTRMGFKPVDRSEDHILMQLSPDPTRLNR